MSQPALAKKKTSLSAGLFWASVAVFFGKICTLLSQVVGGFYLSPEEYGMIAFTVSLLSFIAIFYNYGLDTYLIQKHKEWKTLLPTVWKMMWALTAFSMVLALGAALFYGVLDESSMLFWLILAGLASFPFASFFPLYKAEHAVEGNYIYQSVANAANSIINMAVFIILLLLGMGPVAFFIGALLGNIASYILFRRGIDKIPGLKQGQFEFAKLKTMFLDLRFVSLGFIFNSFALRIDYFVLGLIATHTALGYYFFGFSLTGVLALLFTAGIQGVLTPDLVHKASSHKKFKESVANIEFFTLYISGFLALGFIFILPDFLYMIWGERWDEARFVAMFLCLAMPVAICRATILVALDAMGKWKDKAILNGISFITVALFTWIGWTLGGLVGATVAVAIQRVLFALLVVSFVNISLLKINILNSLLRVVRYSIPLIMMTALGVLFGYIEFTTFAEERGFMALLSKTPAITLFFVGYIALGYLIAPTYTKTMAMKLYDVLGRAVRKD